MDKLSKPFVCSLLNLHEKLFVWSTGEIFSTIYFQRKKYRTSAWTLHQTTPWAQKMLAESERVRTTFQFFRENGKVSITWYASRWISISSFWSRWNLFLTLFFFLFFHLSIYMFLLWAKFKFSAKTSDDPATIAPIYQSCLSYVWRITPSISVILLLSGKFPEAFRTCFFFSSSQFTLSHFCQPEEHQIKFN